VIREDNPMAADVLALLSEHLAFARRHSPPADVHTLDAAALVADDVTFYSARDGSALLGIAALRQLDPVHVELKSMHTAEAVRGQGIARAMLAHLIGVARARGCTRISLETGTPTAFAPARALYASAGFVTCEPFGEYWHSRASVCMTLALT